MARHGAARRGTARRGTARHRTARVRVLGEASAPRCTARGNDVYPAASGGMRAKVTGTGSFREECVKAAAGQGRAGQSTAGQGRAGQGRSGHGGGGQGMPGQAGHLVRRAFGECALEIYCMLLDVLITLLARACYHPGVDLNYRLALGLRPHFIYFLRECSVVKFGACGARTPPRHV